MEGEHILRIDLLAPEFFKKGPMCNYDEEFSEHPNLEFPNFIDSNILKFGINQFGVQAYLEPMFPEGFPKWAVGDVEGAHERYVKQVASPSYDFLKKSLEESNENLQALRKYMAKTPENNWFGLRDSVEIEHPSSFQWRFSDSFALRGGVYLTDKLLEVCGLSDEALSEQARKHKSLSRYVGVGEKESVNYIRGDSLKDCIHAAVLVYETSQDFK